MGNSNYVEDYQFMLGYHIKEKQFLKESPLYHVQDIKFPLSTAGMKIVDATGRRVKLAGVNWSGGHAARHCVSGLDCRDLAETCQWIRKGMGMNCVRLTFSLQMYFDNNVIDAKLLKVNPHLNGKTGMQIFDITVQELTKAGLMVYLNNHTSKSQWCCSNSDGDGLWWSNEYSEQKFQQCLLALSERYKRNPRVIGMDLRNQIRKANGLTPTWGDKNPKTDWHMQAEKIGNKVQKIAPHWLIIVGGLTYQLDLTGVKEHPVKLHVPNKLVYSGHIYGFSWAFEVITKWKFTSYQGFYQKLFNDQLYVRNLGVPYLLGEFGNNSSDSYWEFMMRLLKETDIDWTYWCLDGYKCDDQEDETYGILTKDYSKPRYPHMFKELVDCGQTKHRSKVHL